MRLLGRKIAVIDMSNRLDPRSLLHGPSGMMLMVRRLTLVIYQAHRLVNWMDIVPEELSATSIQSVSFQPIMLLI